MKTLFLFSLKRRILNPISISLQLIFIAVLSGLFYFDWISDRLNLGFERPYEIVLNEEMRTIIQHPDQWRRQGFEFVNHEGDVLILYNEGSYRVKGTQDALMQKKIYDLLLLNHQQRILSASSDNVNTWLERYESIDVIFEESTDPQQNIKQQLIFIFMTSIYFMMLNFIAVNSNEIILEKTSNVIPLLLSSITSLHHYGLKLVLGFVNLLSQVLSSVGTLAILAYSRYRYDEFHGLLKLASKYLNLPDESLSIKTLFEWLNLNAQDGTRLLMAFVFMMLGIFTIQIIILVLSSRVKTMEEASSIQGPFYLGLLLLYYISIGLNQSQHLYSFTTRLLSYVPITSLMIMPLRLLSQTVYSYEVIISLIFSVLFMISILIGLFPIYRAGILDDRLTL